MSTIVTRSGKGTALTHTEVDANFTNLNTDKAATADVILATQKGAASGVCPLDATSKVASTYLPSYVDDVLEYANLAALPVTGETGKIYVALDTNKTYRWSGSAYIYITSGAVDSVAGRIGVVVLTSADVGLGNVTNNAAVANLSGTNTGDQTLPTTLPASDVYAWAKNATKPTYTATEVGLGSANNTSDTSKPISTATQTALDLKSPLASPTLSNPTYTGTLTGSTGILNIGSGQLYKDASGNVGIGTSSPSAILSVSQNTNAQSWLALRNTNAGSSASSGLLFGNDANAAYGALYVNSSTNTGFGGANSINLGSYGAYPLTFLTSSTERMRIDSSGNVGIGTAPYDSNVGLTVYKSQNSLFYQDVQNPNTGSSAGAIFRLISSNAAGSGTVSADFVKYKTGGLVINNTETNSAAFMSFGVGASERMCIDSSGYVTTPYRPAFTRYTSSTWSGATYTTFTSTNSAQFTANVGSHFNTSTGRFTAPVAGIYVFHTIGTNNNATTIRGLIQFRVNDISQGEFVEVGLAYQDVGSSGVFKLAVGDYVTIADDYGSTRASAGSFMGYFLG